MSIPATGNRIDAYRLPTFTLQATPEAPFGITYQEQKNGCGSAQFSIPLDDGAYGDIDINDVIAIRRDGDTAFSFVVEMIEEHTLDANGGARQIATYLGRGVGVFLEWMVIAPALGDQAKPIEEDAVFDWRSTRYDPADDSWASATEIMSVADAAAGGWPTQPMAAKFDLTTGAQMISDSSGSDIYAARFWRLFYRDITVAESGRHAIELLMDDKGFFGVDGIQQLEVMREDGYQTASFKRLILTAGVHRFWWAVYNFEDPDNPGDGLGPSSLAYNFYKADLQDRPLTGGQYEISDSTTKVLYVDNDPWPGMTVGEIFADHLLPEADDRGAIPWVSPSFSKPDDSDLAGWDRVAGITTKTGTTNGLQFVDELVAAGRISQWRVRNDGVTFDLFEPGYSNRPTPGGDTVLLEPAPVDDPRSGQLIQLDRRIT